MAVPPTGPGVCGDAMVAGPELLAAALDAAAEAIALLDADGRCVHLNPAACTVLETPADALLGRPCPFPAAGDERARPHRSTLTSRR